ncbi:hypothetical protein [Amycolatopsis thermoflava]|uniref:hypothetical protein n=1 Tax=Amycolatopsis thermoflava TaxID=84480 RepID=UPI003662D01B
MARAHRARRDRLARRPADADLHRGADANSGQTGEALSLGVRLWRLFSYCTIESDLVVLAAAPVPV